MPINFDVSNDFAVFDWLESIQYQRRTSDTVFATPVTVTNCLHREENKDIQNDPDADLITLTAIWEVWANNISFTPVRGDRFTDAESKTWIVEEVDYSDKITRYRLHCRDANQGYQQ